MTLSCLRINQPDERQSWVTHSALPPDYLAPDWDWIRVTSSGWDWIILICQVKPEGRDEKSGCGEKLQKKEENECTVPRGQAETETEFAAEVDGGFHLELWVPSWKGAWDVGWPLVAFREHLGPIRASESGSLQDCELSGPLRPLPSPSTCSGQRLLSWAQKEPLRYPFIAFHWIMQLGFGFVSERWWNHETF